MCVSFRGVSSDDSMFQHHGLPLTPSVEKSLRKCLGTIGNTICKVYGGGDLGLGVGIANAALNSPKIDVGN